MNEYCKKGCCKLYVKIKEQTFQPIFYSPFDKLKAGVVVLYEDKILLTQSYNNKWGIPKGKKEQYDLTMENCAYRELYEETGLNLSIESHLLWKVIMGCYIYKIVIDNIPKFQKRYSELDCTGIGWIKVGCCVDLKLNRLTREVFHMLRKP
jgi:8-oxo-dGTP pyrophosphatase MutT (NUDIX family)